MNMEKVIQVSNLTKKFGHFTAVDHITFDVEEGEIFGFLGANGAGKTTAMQMLCGISDAERQVKEPWLAMISSKRMN